VSEKNRNDKGEMKLFDEKKEMGKYNLSNRIITLPLEKLWCVGQQKWHKIGKGLFLCACHVGLRSDHPFLLIYL
jgi:hypothetical protein